MISNFKVIKGEVETAINIMKEVAKWGRSAGLNVWEDESLTKERLMVGLDEYNFYIGQVSEDNACCMILQWCDTIFWPKAKENESGYIHKLCIRRDYSGIGLSRKMVEFAIEECIRRDVHYLRLDTGWSKIKLCNLYEGLGFKLIGKSLLEDRGEFALFEMNIQ